ncbi:6598_t:CDS:10 [Paraglomus brasilianum]|uniref:6598_t:CDS:1 n=1 Tax=Paraglomus brasilianum TaxID=144538 RepID=A0A9N9GZJ4_9GLOM|nr:6598_t:CDS:10 [Paraglomus brasilianum]
MAKLEHARSTGYERKGWTKNIKQANRDDKLIQKHISERNVLMEEQHNEILKNSIVRDQVILSSLKEHLSRKRPAEYPSPSGDLFQPDISNTENDNCLYDCDETQKIREVVSVEVTDTIGKQVCTSKRTLRNIKPIDYNENLNKTNLSESDHEEKEIDKRKRHESDYDNDYEPSDNSSVSSNSDYDQKKKRKINKGKQPESKVTAKCDNRSVIKFYIKRCNNITRFINQEQLPIVIVTNPTTQTPRTPPPRPNVDNIQVTPQKSVLIKESVTYLQNHIKINVNDQGTVIKDNHTSVEISSIIRNWLVTVLSEGPLKRNIGERTFIVERIVPLFKAIQSAYKEYKFHWIEIELDCMREVKKIFPKFNLTINQADGLGVRNSSNKAIMFIEVSGGPENTDPKHVKEDSEKLLKEAVFGLVSLLRNYLDKHKTQIETRKSTKKDTINYIRTQWVSEDFVAEDLKSTNLSQPSTVVKKYMKLLKVEIFREPNVSESIPQDLWNEFGQWACFNKNQKLLEDHEIPEMFQRHPKDKLVIADETTKKIINNVHLDGYKYILKPWCIKNVFGETIIDFFDLSNPVSARVAQSAVDDYYEHTRKHVSHQSNQFINNLAEQFGCLTDSNIEPYVTASTASNHSQDHRSCVNKLTRELQPLSRCT